MIAKNKQYYKKHKLYENFKKILIIIKKKKKTFKINNNLYYLIKINNIK